MKKKSIGISLILFFGMVLLFTYGFQQSEQGVEEQDLQRVQQAIQKAALECYSIEGMYPEDIAYLKQHYGLYIQDDLYSIRYEYIGSNVMPQTHVYRKEGN